MKSPSEENHQLTCFVVMPFSRAKSINNKYEELNFDDLETIFSIYSDILSQKGYRIFRSDSVGDILSEIILALDSADLILADLTGLNPNVMYELGIRHGFTKKTILTSQDIAEVPFDLNKYYCIEYKWKTLKDKKKLTEDIFRVIEKIDSAPNTKFGPVHSYLNKRETFDKHFLFELLNHYDAVGAELTIIKKEMQVELHLLFKKMDLFKYLNPSDNSLVIGNIPENILNTDLELSTEFQLVFQRRYAAIEYCIARNIILPFLNRDSSISSFNTVLRNTFMHFTPSIIKTLSPFIGFLRTFSELHEDLGTIRSAIDQEAFSENLNLTSISKLHSFEEVAKL